MKILIIGSKGFIGSHCVDYFESKGHDVWTVDVNQFQGVNSFLVDRHNSNFSIPFQKHKFEICINASGSAQVGFSFENPSKDFELNVINVQKILIAIRDYNIDCKFINFSSAAVYGNPESLPISEKSSCIPLSPYGFHKLQSELLLMEYNKFFSLKTCSLRIFSAYGPRLKKQLFWDLYQKSTENQIVSLFGTGTETRDFIYIDDVIQTIDLIIHNSPFDGTTYNVGNNTETTIAEAASLFMATYSPEKELVFSGLEKVGDPINWKANNSKIVELGYKKRISLAEGIEKYVLWAKELK